MTPFRKKSETDKVLVPAGSAPCTMQFKFANNHSSLLENVRLGYKIRVTPPPVETIKLGRRRRAKASLDILESELSSQREILETSTTRVTELEREAIELQNEINEKLAKLESIRADEERLKKLLGSTSTRGQQRPSNGSNSHSHRFLNDDFSYY